LTTDKISPDFAKALVKAQGEIEGAKKEKRNPGFNSKYADLSNCWDACREALQTNSIAVLQWPCKADPEHVGMVTTLVFGPTGETLSGEFQLPLTGKKDAQAAGSAITYARRYALCAAIGICPEDDDGNAASSVSKNRGSSGEVLRTEPNAKDKVNAAGYKYRFISSSSLDERKSVYTEVKNSGLPEPMKTEMLVDFAKTITSEKASSEKASMAKGKV